MVCFFRTRQKGYRWHFRQAVLANMRGAGQPVFENDFPPQAHFRHGLVGSWLGLGQQRSWNWAFRPVGSVLDVCHGSLLVCSIRSDYIIIVTYYCSARLGSLSQPDVWFGGYLTS